MSRDIAQWEKRNKGSLKSLNENMKMTDIYVVAHLSAVRQGLYTGTEQEFQDGCDIDILDDDEVDPTKSAA
jgi:hypothetical protein